MSSIVPAVGHFHTMLEAARVAKTNKKNADIGDLGQRLRLAWKQACLIDQRAGAFVGSEVVGDDLWGKEWSSAKINDKGEEERPPPKKQRK